VNFTIEANAFLFRMVRSLVGSMKMVGEGKWTNEDFANAFEACDRNRTAKLAPACGLFLTAVRYE
jgi:tRNA pseudouridine38-40 synthase